MIRLAVRCRAEDAERVLAELLELAPGGVEEEHGEGWAEYAVYGAPGELPALPDLDAAAGAGMVDVTSSEVPDDWADRWRDFHEAVTIGGRLVVRPSWRARPSGNPGTPGSGAEEVPGVDVDVVIDPGQAFGTGAHATTRLCLELLLELADAGEASGSLADLGTGSGVLAIAAAKLGFSPVLGCDNELPALDAAAHNARANGVELELLRVNLREEAPPVAGTLVANLTAPLLVSVASRIADPPTTVVCSGLLADERDEVVGAFAEVGLEPAGELEAGGWAALLLRRGRSVAGRG